MKEPFHTADIKPNQTGEALERVMEASRPTFLAHWEVGYKIHVDQSSQYREWIIEVVKHLAIINTAGLAGVVALVSLQGSDLVNRHSLVLAGVSFIFGLTLAVFDMYLNAMGFLRRAQELSARIEELRTLYKESSIGLLEKLNANAIEAPFRKGRYCFAFAEACGWGAAISFVAGCVYLYNALKHML